MIVALVMMMVLILMVVLVLMVVRRMTESTKRGWGKNSRNVAFKMSQRNPARHNGDCGNRSQILSHSSFLAGRNQDRYQTVSKHTENKEI